MCASIALLITAQPENIASKLSHLQVLLKKETNLITTDPAYHK